MRLLFCFVSGSEEKKATPTKCIENNKNYNKIINCLTDIADGNVGTKLIDKHIFFSCSMKQKIVSILIGCKQIKLQWSYFFFMKRMLINN